MARRIIPLEYVPPKGETLAVTYEQAVNLYVDNDRIPPQEKVKEWLEFRKRSLTGPKGTFRNRSAGAVRLTDVEEIFAEAQQGCVGVECYDHDDLPYENNPWMFPPPEGIESERTRGVDLITQDLWEGKFSPRE